MNMFPETKFFVDDLPKEICIETNIEVDNPRFMLRLRSNDQGCGTPCVPVRLLECQKCKYTAFLGEELAACGEGIFDLELWDDCEVCDSVCVELSADCYFTSATMTAASAVEKRCC